MRYDASRLPACSNTVSTTIGSAFQRLEQALVSSLRTGHHAQRVFRAAGRLKCLMAAGEKPTPTEIKLHHKSRVLEVSFSDGSRFELPYEFLRVHSPSAEVRAHGPGQEVLQSGKKEVDILSLEPVGSYAVQPHFSDGHGTGIYSWDYLRELGANRESLWHAYLKRLEAAGARREP